jgi:hypothetical protein
VICDQFGAMVHALLGNPMPPLPLLPGRRHALVDDFDAPDDLSGMSATDVAAAVGISRQGAHLRIQRAIQTGNWSGLLAPKSLNASPVPAGQRCDVSTRPEMESTNE